jgi:mono/diheme cytochrome c family protein
MQRFPVLFVCAFLFLSRLGHAQEGRGLTLPDGDAKELTTMVCSQCHGLKETLLLRDGQKGWEDVVDRMVLYGAQLTPAEAARVSRYLGTELGPGKDLMVGGSVSPHGGRGAVENIALPAGPGQALVATRCILCHDLGRVTGVNRSTSDWEAITTSMLRGLNDSPNEVQTMISYLQTNFSRGGQAIAHVQMQSAPRRSNDVFAQKCQLCHSIQAGKNQLGPSLFGEMREPHPKKTEQEIRTIVRDGKGKMPAFKDLLTEEDTDNLITYLRSL